MGMMLKTILAIAACAVILRFNEYWFFGATSDTGWLENLNEKFDLEEQLLNREETLDWHGTMHAKRKEKEFFEYHSDPLVHSQRCDACRLIASKFEHAFELAEHRLAIQTHNFDEYEELADEDIDEVYRQVCSRSSFKYVFPVTLREVERLAAYGLETDGYLPKASEVTIDLLWSKRLRNHCKYIADHLKGRDMYDMWLKTATGIDKKYFEHFLCFGEGVFGDCVDRDRVFGDDGIMSWPAGDDPATNEEEEEEIEDNGFGIHSQIVMDHFANSAPSGLKS